MLNTCKKANGSQSRTRFLCLAALWLAATTLIQAQNPPSPPPDTRFTDQTASALLRRLSESLQGHSEKKFLALFDLQKMNGGQLFKQQVDSFFSQTESIRVHLNLMETSPPYQIGGEAMAVEAEMEVQPSNGGAAWRRSERLVFTAVRAGRDWKLNGVSPNSFFSLP